MNILEFQCRHRYRSGFELDVAFALQEGITALLGPSGSGKTTILEAIAGVLRPASGRIRLDDRVLFDSEIETWLPPEERRVGIVFQDYLLFPHMSVERNLRYGMQRRGEGRIPLEQVARLLDLGDLLERYPVTLSGGQRQRTALGRALLSGPRLLLMDEPLNAQDEELRSRIVDYLERVVHEFNVTTLLVSHDADAVKRLGARCLALANGRLIQPAAGDDCRQVDGRSVAK
jgi:molybdate transport system ATP-binding protein